MFEPGLNNLRYISQNISAKPNIRMERVAVSDETGTAAFFEDNIGRQTTAFGELSKGRNDGEIRIV